MAVDSKMINAGAWHRRTLNVDVFDAARQRMRFLYENFDTVSISWSGGKDSSCCLELAREAARATGRLPVKVMFLDEEVIYPETLDLCYRHMADPEIEFYCLAVPSIYRNACSEKEPDFVPWDPAKRDLWTHEPLPGTIWPCGFDDNGLPVMSGWRVPPSIGKHTNDYLFNKPECGKSVQVLGLRTRESMVRFTGLMTSRGYLTQTIKNMAQARPIYDWTAGDVWLAIKENGWDYNKAYDKLWRAGGSAETTRVAPLFHAEAAMMLRRVMLYWPKFWPLVRRRVRGAHSVAIYGGALHAVRRLPGENWRMATERALTELGSEQDRVDMWKLVQRWLNNHAKHSSLPMPDDRKHRCVKCGLSWQNMCTAVTRGDRQQRMLVTYGMTMGVSGRKGE